MIALIDLYDGIENEGIRAISESVENLIRAHPEIDFVFDRLETRLRSEMPGLDYDLYISSGGPGSPFDGDGMSWDSGYRNWIQSVYDHNLSVSKSDIASINTSRKDVPCGNF